jgi:AcrR family transcriptional regulator
VERVKRQYTSKRRREQAQETRRSILNEALELFTSQGFAETSIREIAERAGVSEQTVYNAFGDKIGLLCGAAEEYADLDVGAEDAAFLAALEAEADPLKRIRMVASDSRKVWESGILEMEQMILNRELRDPRISELAQELLAGKLAGTRAVCAVLFPDSIRRPGLTLDDIAVFGTAMDSAATVTTLRALGWGMDQWEEWLVALLTLFLDPERFAGQTGQPPEG